VWDFAEAAATESSSNDVFVDGKPTLLGETRADSGEGRKHAEATSHVPVQRRPRVCSTEDLGQVSLLA